MRSLVAITWMFVLVGCGKAFNKNSNSSDLKTVSSPAVSAFDIELVGSRDYFPNQWSDGEITNSIKTWYTAPIELELIQGNAGMGWVSLYIGPRTFCYQGNSTTVDSGDGNKFILQYEKTSPDEECSSNKGNFGYEQRVLIGVGDKLRLKVDGGNCGDDCVRTEVRALIRPRQD